MSAEVFGPYRLEALLGRGGMGEVWRAVDTGHDDRPVAIKVLLAGFGHHEEFVRRFRRECALASKLVGPHIIGIHSYGEIDGRLYIEMPLVDGLDLGALLERDGPLPAQRAVRIVDQVADALDIAHAAGLVHRDVKPSNVLVTGPVGREFAYLIDFGIARAVDGTKFSQSGALVGTYAYMAPERFDGRGDHRSDGYALGCVLYEVLTGRRPFEAGSALAYMRAHDSLPPPRPSAARPELPVGLDDVVARALAKNPDDRFPSAGALAAAARALLQTRPAPSPSGPDSTPWWDGPSDRSDRLAVDRAPPAPAAVIPQQPAPPGRTIHRGAAPGVVRDAARTAGLPCAAARSPSRSRGPDGGRG